MRLSVIIPAYNAQAHLSQCLSSALAALVPESEVLLVDDGSDDDTYSIAEEFARQRGRIRVLTHPGRVNRGVAASRNLGLLHATGDYISFLDADDLCLSSRFRLAIERLEGAGDLDGALVPVKVHFEPEAGAGLRSVFPDVLGHDPDTAADEFAAATLTGRSRFHISNVVFRRALLAQCGPFDNRLELGAEDTEFWLRMALCGRFCVVSAAEPQVTYRRHGTNNWTPDSRDSFRDLRIIGSVIKWVGGKTHIHPKHRRALRDAYFQKLIYCLVLARTKSLRREGAEAAVRAVAHIPNLALDRRYWANVYHFLLSAMPWKEVR